MVDKPLVLRKISMLDAYMGQLEGYARISSNEYSSDWKTQRIVERTLQLMIEVCADIADHIIAESGLRVPSSYADTFKVLYENSVIDGALLEGLKKMSGFRNIIVHQYEDIDPGIVMNILKNGLKDFGAFKEAALRHIG